MAHLKRSIIEVRAETNCLAQALIIAIARIDRDPNYVAYLKGYKILPKVQHLLETTGINLTNGGGGVPELIQFHSHFAEYRIVVFGGLDCEDIVFDGQIESEKRINLLYDEVNKHYHVIANLTGAMAKRYVCNGCNKGCTYVTHKCQETCSDCMSSPPCVFSGVRIPCVSCNRTFRSQSCFDRHKIDKLRGKTVCERMRNCANCGHLLRLTRIKHEFFKPYCINCGQNRDIGHLCYMIPLKDELPASDDVLFVSYDFETTQDTRISDSATVHVSNLVCLQQFCSLCETEADIDEDCERCGKRKYSFFDDPVGDLLSHLCLHRPWCEKVVAIEHNARAFDAQFILNRAILLKWKPKLIMNGLKIICMTIHHMTFIDSVSFLPMALRKLPEAFGLSVTKSWYPHYFNTGAN